MYSPQFQKRSRRERDPKNERIEKQTERPICDLYDLPICGFVWEWGTPFHQLVYHHFPTYIYVENQVEILFT